jgi:hypothetical protein
MKVNLKEELKKQFEEHELSSTQLKGLQKSPPKRKVFVGWGMALVASLALIFTFYQGNSLPLEDRIAQEIAYNHVKRMEMEIKTSDISSVQSKLNKLDFSIFVPARFKNDDWKIVGGRYCSIQGVLAAQIRIHNISENKTYTLYETLKSEKLNSSFIKDIKGTKVEVWEEKGLLIGIAGEQ